MTTSFFKPSSNRGKRLEQQVFELPFDNASGIKFEATIRRSDLGFAKWEQEAMGKLGGFAVRFTSQLQKGIIKAQTGMRHSGLKGKAAQIVAKMSHDKMLDDAIEAINLDGEMEARVSLDIAELIPGIKEHLLVSLVAVTPDGERMEADEAAIDEMLTNPEGIDGEHADFGETWGDAVAMWIMVCGDFAESFYDRWKQSTAKNLPWSLAGGPSTGTTEAPPSESSSATPSNSSNATAADSLGIPSGVEAA